MTATLARLTTMVMFCASLAEAQTLSPGADGADILIIGETHDNPAHHSAQAALVRQAAPSALVFEMLGYDQSRSVTPLNRIDEKRLEAALNWNASGWPDFAMYYPIFTAAPKAAIYGAAIPRERTRDAMQSGAAGAFGRNADVFGLDAPLEAAQQSAREALQMSAHCDALPENLLPGMVTVQRLRDAALAREAIQAFADTGGPVVVIAGNGHARRDWGIPAALARAAPDLAVWSVGQSEDGMAPEGGFDEMIDAPAAKREDPCAAFR